MSGPPAVRCERHEAPAEGPEPADSGFSGLPALDRHLVPAHLAIDAGEMVAVVGPSGSGKSTILNMITGIDRPTAGTVTVDGTRLDELTEEELAVWRGANVGIIFQFFQLLPTLSALENAALPLDFLRRGSKRERFDRARHNLELVGRHWGTMVFTTLALLQLGHALAVRSERQSFFVLGARSNPWLLAAVMTTAAVQFAIVYVPFLQDVFGTAALGPVEFAVVTVASTTVFFAVEVEKWLRRRRTVRREPEPNA